MVKRTKNRQASYERAVIQTLQRYGVACEEFGRASKGSARGMENTMRHAQEVARDTLGIFLGRDATLDELDQIPPLYELPIVAAKLVAPALKRRRKVKH